MSVSATRQPLSDRTAGPGPQDALREAIRSFMPGIDRSQARGEAQFAVLEGALHLLDGPGGRPAGGEEQARALREALGAVRAAVVATGFALTQCGSARPAGPRDGGG